VTYTAGAGLIVADISKILEEGVQIAATAIDNGKAKMALKKMIKITNE